MRRSPRPAISNVLWLALAALWLFPLGWTIISSFKTSNVAIFDRPFELPDGITFANYQQAIRAGDLDDYFINSIWVTGLSVTFTVLFGMWAGHVLARHGFPGRRFWLTLFFVGMILPVQSFIIPLGDLLQVLGVHDSLWGLILPYTAQSLPVAILLFSAYFLGLPAELTEAARMDGVSTPRFYFQILLPAAKPAVATVAVLTVLNTWNEFLMALLFIVDPAMRTLPVGMIAFEQAHNTNYPALLAGLSIMAVPALVAYAIFNRQVIQGVTSGAVK
jgi:raffinose/stachyose/melibiose transport system permease protein